MIRTAVDIFKSVEQAVQSNPKFKVAALMPEQQEQWMANMAEVIAKKLIPIAGKDHLVYDEKQGALLEEYIHTLNTAIASNDQAMLDALCTNLANQYSKDPKYEGTECSDCSDHDPACIPTYIDMFWWTTLTCIPKPLECIIKHAALAVEKDKIFLGHCDNEGGEVCKCFPVGWSLSTLLLLLTVGTFLFAGPVLGGAARELIRQTVTRLAGVGAA